VNVFCLPTKILSEKQLFFDGLKRLLVVQILEVTDYQENAEHIGIITFHWQSEKVEMGGTCLGEKRINTAKSCIQLLQIVLPYRTQLYKKLCPGISR